MVSNAIALALAALRVCALWNTYPWIKALVIASGAAYFIASAVLGNYIEAYISRELLRTLEPVESRV